MIAKRLPVLAAVAVMGLGLFAFQSVANMVSSPIGIVVSDDEAASVRGGVCHGHHSNADCSSNSTCSNSPYYATDVTTVLYGKTSSVINGSCGVGSTCIPVSSLQPVADKCAD